MTIRIGLVSDTHMPMRLRELPPALFDALEGVDLVLHAGDVGDLTVLDQLSAIAPVVAVHGNDDSEESRRSLPYRSVVACAGIRILLWHSHFEDRKREFESRQDDAFLPKLRHISRQAENAGAELAVFGHWHIPLAREVDGVCLLNPGAVASGNEITRQLVQSVAVLELDGNRGYLIRHIDLARPQETFEPNVDWDSGFKATLRRFSASIFTPELEGRLPSFLAQISDEEQNLLRPPLYRLAQRCWDGEFDLIDTQLIREELAKDPSFTSEQKQRYVDLLA